MSKLKIALYSFLHAAGVIAYITMLALLFSVWAPDRRPFIGPLVMLTTFVISATVTGGLVLARPITLYLDKQKKDAFAFLISTIIWLVACVGIIILVSSRL